MEAINVEMIPFAEDDMNVIVSDLLVSFEAFYVIVGRTLGGARFISENLKWEEIAEMIKKYEATVKYFGGGTVDIYEVVADDCDIIYSEVCW